MAEGSTTDIETPCRRLSTLFVCPFSPYPLNFGGAIRLFNLVQVLHEFSDVSVVYFRPWDDREALEALGEICTEVVPVIGPAHRPALVRARSMLSSHSFQYLNHRDRAFQRAIDGLIDRRQFDVIVTEMTQMASYDLSRSQAVRVLDLQNIEHELVRRRAAVVGRGPRRWALELEWRKLRREELAACRRYDLVFMPSDRERDLLSDWAPGSTYVTVPNAIDPSRFSRRADEPGRHEVVFIGLTHVDANRDGVCWFVDEILPHLEQRVPDVHVTIVGGEPPPSILRYKRRHNIEVTGYVDDVAPYLERAAVSIVPLRSGGGTRLKILEALSAGVPTVSTAIGAEGLELVDGIHIRIADTPTAFASAVSELLLDHDLQRRMADAGSSEVNAKYSWHAQRGRVESAIREKLELRA